MIGDLVAIAPLFAVSLILALSCYIVLKSGEISFGQQTFFGAGAYASGILTVMFGWPLAPALAAGACAGLTIASLVGISLCRLSGFKFTLMTLVLGEFAKEAFAKIEWRRILNCYPVGPEGPLGFSNIDYYYANGIGKNEQSLIAMLAALLCVVALYVYGHTNSGRRVPAVADDPILAAAVGIRPRTVRLQALAVSGAIAGLGGGIFAHQATFIEASNFSLMVGVHAVAYTLLGGLASVLGPILGTALDIVLLEGLRVVGSYRMVAFGSLLVLMLILRPRGLLGDRNGGPL